VLLVYSCKEDEPVFTEGSTLGTWYLSEANLGLVGIET
tara:strand:+ start:1718 stop:1831 length:114 start_codon:yes stop_codon:yes gene_type:complete